MKITDLARKPQIIEVVLDDAATVAELGEPLTYWTWDRHPMPVFLKLASMRENDTTSIFSAVQDLILDEQGQPVLSDDRMLPVPIMLRIIGRVVETMGKN